MGDPRVAGEQRVAIVAHTHWDREWYEPFQAFRYRLVGLVDRLLDVLESEPGYRSFLLDGQTQAVDDYLELRPDAAPRIERLARAGRLSVGPWRILMDEAMVSGETLVRNLQMGLRRATQIGGLMEVGYLPDMFCHIAQMPQLLALAGLRDAVLWRGVPNAITTTGFWWESPDASRVRVEYLYGSYANLAQIADTGAGLIGLTHDYAAEVGDGLVGDLLLMHGGDHRVPDPALPRVVQAANDLHAGFHFDVVSLAEHLARQPRDDTLPLWRGELRSGARANVLMGTASNHIDVHQRCAAAERALERVAEPLATLLFPAERYPHAALDLAWDQLVLNSAHDSSCACSHDDTVAAVNTRYAEARHLAEAVARDAVRSLGAAVDAPPWSVVVVNPTARARGGLVEVAAGTHRPFHLTTPDGRAMPGQIVGEEWAESTTTVVQGTKVHWLLRMLRDRVGEGMRIRAIEMHDDAAGEHAVTVHRAADDDEPIGSDAIERALAAVDERGRAGATQRITITGGPRRTMLFAVAAVSGFGWTTLRRADGATPAGSMAGAAVQGDEAERTMHNEYVSVTVATDGTYTVTATGITVTGLGRLVDGGDGGDTYNYSPPPDDVIVDAPRAVRVTMTEAGPVRARIEIESEYDWPTHALGDHVQVTARAASTVSVAVHTTLELRAGEAWLRVGHRFDNPSRDHRLRAHFPLPAPVDGSDADCAFAVVHRGLTAEGGPQEHGLPTFVARRFVDCSDGAAGLALIPDGLLEYEVVDGGRELALTLLRSTGWISRSSMAYRAEPAGPSIATPGAQLIGPVEMQYAVLVHVGDWQTAELHAVADAVLVPLRTTLAGSVDAATEPRVPLDPQPATGTVLRVDGAEVSAVHRDDTGACIVRLVRDAPTPGTARVLRGGADAHGEIIDLRGRRIAGFTGRVEMRAWEIVTVRLTP